MIPTQAKFMKASEVFHTWRDGILTRTRPTLYPVGVGELRRVEVGPGMVTLVGGAPNAGKTALTQQWAIDALRIGAGVRACVCNVEMSAAALLDRQLARLSGVDASAIRHRELADHNDTRVAEALATLEAVKDRLCFVRPPFDLENLAATVEAFGADLIVVDYVQRIRHQGQQADTRGAMNAAMAGVRQLADAGKAVIVVSAIGRTRDSSGRPSYDGDGLNLASFRESSELEFGADDAFILVPEAKRPGLVRLRHLKSRYSEPRDIVLAFDKRLQRFADAPSPAGGGEGPQPYYADSQNARTPSNDNPAMEGK